MKATGEQATSGTGMGVVNPNAAGLDIGAEEIYASVPADRDEKPVRRFGTYTPDLEALAEWLVKCQVDTVAMESTGVYWVPVYEMLEARGIEAQVVNARHLKHVPGRKSDVKDCQWIQQLHTYGLLRGSFRPEADIVELRSYLRHRHDLIEHRAAHINHMQKALTLMNVRLTEVVSDITGVTGMGILRAIVAGQHDACQLVRFRQKGCKHSEADFVNALSGHYRREQVFVLKQALTLYDAYTEQITQCDAAIEQQFAVLKPAPDVPDDLPPLDDSSKTNTHSKNAPAYDARALLYRATGVDLCEVDGLNASTVQQIIFEIGTDVSAWPTVKHFCSWLNLAPHNDISGGKVLRSRVPKAPNRAGQALRLAAQSVSKTDTALGAFYRRMRARLGSPQAIVATAHKIARIIYHMLKHRQSYQAMSAIEYDQLQKERHLKSLQRQAERYGMRLVPAT